MSAPDVLKLSVNIIWNPDKLVHRLRTQYTPLDLPRNGAHISLFANRLDVPPAMVGHSLLDSESCSYYFETGIPVV